MIYFGPLGRNSQKIIEYFEVLNFPLIHLSFLNKNSSLNLD